MEKKIIAISIFMLFLCKLDAQVISKFIHIDQFGYTPSAKKVAVLSDPQIGYNAADSYTAPVNMELRNANTDAVVFSASPTPWNGGLTHNQSGDKGWWFDFSSHTSSGTFYVYDPVNDERSGDFEISVDVYNEVLKASVKMFYYNRCNLEKVAPYAAPNWTDGNNFENNLQDANCRYVYDQSNASLEKDLTGGWFDAGDYNKYTTFANSAVQMLLSSFEDNPGIFTDDWNIPESGNGVPDLLDEVKWELDWLLKMTNDDGAAIIKMGSISYNDNAAAPPSVNTDQRFYGPICTSSTINVAGMFAHAAIIYEGFPGMDGFVANLETEAEAAWNYVLPLIEANQFDLNCDDGTIKSGDADRTVGEQKEEALIAAIYLFSHFGDGAYNDYVIDHINDAEPIIGDFWSPYKMPLQDAMLHYTTLSGADATTKNIITTSFTNAVTNNWNGFYGFDENDDLYRSFMPDWAYHWGSSLPKAGFGCLNLLANKYGINSGSAADYRLKAKEQLHSFHGVNPQGYVYLSNMYDFGADRSINEIYHTWFNDGTDWDNALTSLYGPAPGFVTGGPNSTYDSNLSLSPPYNQPVQKSYLDFNSGGNDESWEITEPAIYYQAFYVRLVSNLASFEAPLPVDWLDPLWGYYEKGENLLFWTTELEIDNAYFEVERSIEGQNWSVIGRVEGMNNFSGTNNKYAFKDTTPLKGLNYYRLRQVDADERFEYSNIITIDNKSINTILVVPNPVKDVLHVSSNIENGRIDVLNLNGTLLSSQLFSGRNMDIDLSNLPKGIYFIKLMDEPGNQMVEKIVKH